MNTVRKSVFLPVTGHVQIVVDVPREAEFEDVVLAAADALCEMKTCPAGNLCWTAEFAGVTVQFVDRNGFTWDSEEAAFDHYNKAVPA